jgi:S-methylmethionine-dependent homocysteine/selenocysteine methylase
MEGAVVEPLRRSGRVVLHPRVLHAPLIYDAAGRQELEAVYQAYIDVAKDHRLPLLLATPTWRANRERIREAGLPTSLNTDAAAFLRELRARQAPDGPPIRIGGVIGCCHDCYRAEEGLGASDSESFHQWQVDQLARAGIDFLIAETLPGVEEATGIARAMAKTTIPYFISFVIDRNGRVLDGTGLDDAMQRIDDDAPVRPLGFMVNCAHPSFLCADRQPARVFDRLAGYLANASSLDHCDLDGATELHADDVAVWGEQMLRLNRRFGVRILGGCCGTGPEHLKYLAGA